MQANGHACRSITTTCAGGGGKDRTSLTGVVCLLLIVLLLMPGCLSEYLGRRLVAPTPNGPAAPASPPEMIQSVLTIPVGPPDANLYCWVMEPRPYIVITSPADNLVGDGQRIESIMRQRRWSGQIACFTITHHGSGPSSAKVECICWNDSKEEATTSDQWRGTIILMHGWGSGLRECGAYLLPLAASLCDAGYRVVNLDLRAQGDSTGRYLTYGYRDAKDLQQVIDWLQERRLAGPEVVLIGHSYGAAAALAASNDDRVAGAIALSPPLSMRHMLPTVREWAKTGSPVLYFFLNPWVTDSVWQDAVACAGRIAEFEPDEVDATLAIRRAKAPVLLVHGTADRNCIYEWSQKILAASTGETSLATCDGDDHWSYLSREDFRKLVLDWVDARSANMAQSPSSMPAGSSAKAGSCVAH